MNERHRRHRLAAIISIAGDLVAGMLAAERFGGTGENCLLSSHRHSLVELAELAAQVTGVKDPRVSIPLSLIRGLGPLVLKLTPADKIPLFTPDSLHTLRYSPSACHFNASKELGYVPRPLVETLRDTYAWFDDNAANCARSVR